MDRDVLSARVHVICADVSRPDMGLTRSAYATLAEQIDVIYHCAAQVNWARSYRQLRQTNVLGTLEVIRLACAGHSKPVLFVSSMAVCFATGHARPVDESTDMLSHIANMPLGYAQSKCVAEHLLRSASARGLSVTILRPALIGGDTRTGQGNDDDLIAALIEGCACSGLSGDADWLLDCVPVDLVADVLARTPLQRITRSRLLNRNENPSGSCPSELDRDAGSPLVLNLVHDAPRQWSDVV